MSKKPTDKKGVTDDSALRQSVQSLLGREGESGYADFTAGIIVADHLIETVWDQVGEAITAIEVGKKIPDFNTDLSIELAMSCAKMKIFMPDPREDDCHLDHAEDEPKNLGQDNCMSEAIEVKQQPGIGVGGLMNLSDIQLSSKKNLTIGFRRKRTSSKNSSIVGKAQTINNNRTSKFGGGNKTLKERKLSIMDDQDFMNDGESIFQDDDTKSVRSKKSTYSKASKAKSIIKVIDSAISRKNYSPKASTTKRSATQATISSTKDTRPVPTKLDIKSKKLHNDDLTEQHFVELRNYLHKKKRSEDLHAKMQQRMGGRQTLATTRQTSMINDGPSSPTATSMRVDREIVAEMGAAGASQGGSSALTNRPVLGKAGQAPQYTTKERTQCVENDRFLITKKVNVGQLPDPSQNQATIPDPATIKTTVEKSARDVHEAYLQRIHELKTFKKMEEDKKKQAENQTLLLLQLTKKSTFASKDNKTADDQDLLENNQKYGKMRTTKKQSFINGPDATASNSLGLMEEDLDAYNSIYDFVRPVTPAIDEEALNSFDVHSQKIVNLIRSKDQGSIDLCSQSKPVRDTIKATYGVSYVEDVDDGGAANVKILGGSYYSSPGRTMRKDELTKKQVHERASIVKHYQKSRMDDITANSLVYEDDQSKSSRYNAKRNINNRTIDAKLNQSNTGDSLFQPSNHTNLPASPRVDLPSISHNGTKRVMNSFQTVSSRTRQQVKPIRDQMVLSGQDQFKKLQLFDTGKSENIEVLDGGCKDRPIFSPANAGSYMKGINSVFDWKAGDTLDISSMGDVGRIQTSIGSHHPGRPVSQRQHTNRKSPRVINRSIKLKDEITNVMRSSCDRATMLKQSYNFGKIMNYKKTEGINDQCQGTFRKWTGMPQTTRLTKISGMPINNQAKLVADHRKKTFYPTDVEQTKVVGRMVQSQLASVDESMTKQRNISQTAWNKIRQVEIKKRERLDFNL